MTRPENFSIEEMQFCHLKDRKFLTYLCLLTGKVKEKKIKEKENSMSLKLHTE